MIQGNVSGLYQNSLTIVSSFDGTSIPVSSNGAFSMTVFASPIYFDLRISSNADHLHCIVWDRGVWDGTNQINWRLPLYTEMFSIIHCRSTNAGVITGEDGCLTVGDGTKYPGATADPILFPGTIAAHYWSSQTIPGVGDVQAYMINFDPGNESYLNKDLSAYVRCVSE